MLERSDRLFLFVRRVWCEHPEQAGEVELMNGFTGKDEMSDVRRVKGAAKSPIFP